MADARTRLALFVVVILAGVANIEAADGKRHADSILMNVANGNFEAAKTSVTPLGATCASCHGKYRERMEDGTFRIKTAG